MGRPSIRVKLMITSKDDDRFTNPRTLIVSQMLHLQLVLQIRESEQLTIQSENRCERDQERFITSSGKSQIPFEQNTSGNPQRSAISIQRI